MPLKQIKHALVKDRPNNTGLFWFIAMAGFSSPYWSPWLSQTWVELWFLDLFVHWQWFFAALLGLGILRLAWRQRRWLLVLPIVFTPYFTAPAALSSALSSHRHPANGLPLVFATANVQKENTEPQRLLAWLAAEQVDIAFISEVNPTFAQGLASYTALPAQILRPQEDPFGVALLSRYPIRRFTVTPDHNGDQHLEAEIEVQGRSIHVIGLHPMPPLDAATQQQRDQLIHDLAQRYATLPAVMLGDFNATPWSSAFVGLADVGWQRASGVRPTWPSQGHGWMGIPIDHVVATTPHWQGMTSHLGATTGSDHFPVVARLALVPAKTPN